MKISLASNKRNGKNDHARVFLAYIKQSIVEPVLSGHSKIDKTKVLKTNGSLMKVKSITECSLRAFDLH